MNNKLLVELVVPELDSIYNIYIPINIKIGKVVDLLNKSLNDLTKGIYVKENNLLYNDQGEIFNMNISVLDSTIISGCRIILY